MIKGLREAVERYKSEMDLKRLGLFPLDVIPDIKEKNNPITVQDIERTMERERDFLKNHKTCYGMCALCAWRHNGGCSEWEGDE